MNFEARSSFPRSPDSDVPSGSAAPRQAMRAGLASGTNGGTSPGLARLTTADFARLIQRARPALAIVAAAVLGDRVEADDVVQEASVIGLAQLDRFTPGTSFEGWMAQIVRNVARNAARKRARNPASPAGHETLTTHPARVQGSAFSQGSPAVSPDGTKANPAAFDIEVQRALQSLDETSRVCLLLRTVGELSYSQIAAITEINENTAMSHVFRSRKALRHILAAHHNGRNGQGEGKP